jgi:hypothetical protein
MLSHSNGIALNNRLLTHEKGGRVGLARMHGFLNTHIYSREWFLAPLTLWGQVLFVCHIRSKAVVDLVSLKPPPMHAGRVWPVRAFRSAERPATTYPQDPGAPQEVDVLRAGACPNIAQGLR